MKMAKNARTVMLAVALSTGAAAQAAVLPFTANLTATSSPIMDSACGSQFHAAVLPGNGNGTSTLGNFGYTSNTCVTAGGPVSGTFTIDFASDGFQGLLDGIAGFTGTPGNFNPSFTYTILTGTGRFAGATGTFLGTGSIIGNVPPSRLNLQFAGSINAPAVPEPATWAMMLLGFGATGMAVRRSRRQASALQTA